MWSEYDVRLVGARGERTAALKALRAITGLPLSELSAWLADSGALNPRFVFKGTLEQAQAFARQYGDVLELELWTDAQRDRAVEPSAPGPYRAQRDVAATPTSTGGVRFGVDDVVPATKRLPTEDASVTWRRIIDGDLVHCETPHPLVVSPTPHLHPLACSVQLAFDEHRPLRVSPDAVWLTITTGFALHVEHNAEALRGRFVSHQGRRTLPVLDQGTWPEKVDAFTALLAKELGEGRRRVFTCDFSTSTAVDRTASQIVMMGAFKRYFDFLLAGVCGIPEVELLGTVDDWRAIRARIEILAEYGVEAWVAALRPLADEWIETAAGRPDLRFWRAIYKPKQVYAASLVRGWLTQLFPYLAEGRPNPSIGSGGPHTDYTYEGIALESLPSGRTLAPVRTEEGCSYELLGGLAGVAQDDAGWLQAISGWAVVERPLSLLIDRLKQRRDPEPEHEGGIIESADGEADGRERLPVPCPAELLEVSERLGACSLHEGRWRLRGESERARHPRPQEVDNISLLSEFTVFADLHDHRRACYLSVYPLRVFGAEPDWWVVILSDDEEASRDTPVVAKGIRQFLERVLDEGDQPFFDAPGFMPESTLAETKRW